MRQQVCAVSCTLAVSLEELVLPSDPCCRICGINKRLTKTPSACKTEPQPVTTGLQNAITTATDSFRLGSREMRTLISFWCEHLLQWPVMLMTCCNSSVSQKTVKQANPDGGTAHYKKELLHAWLMADRHLNIVGQKSQQRVAASFKIFSHLSIQQNKKQDPFECFSPVFTHSWQQVVVQRSKAHKMTLVGCDLCKYSRPSSCSQKG